MKDYGNSVIVLLSIFAIISCDEAGNEQKGIKFLDGSAENVGVQVG